VQELAPGIVLFNDVFLDSMNCIKEIEKNFPPWQPAEVLVKSDTNTSGTDYKARDTDLIMLPHHGEVVGRTDPLSVFVDKFHASIAAPLRQYMNTYGAKIETFENPQLLRYGPGQKFHDHIDDHPFFTRRISLTFYINDEYEGGDIEFNRLKVRVSAKANQLLVFPSNFIYNHQVHPVINGTRYVVVQWMA
jgi:hypothetical protein